MADLPGALSVKPNPFYKPPHQMNEVTRQLAQVIAPPNYHANTGPDIGVLNIHWVFWKVLVEVAGSLGQPPGLQWEEVSA